MKNKTLLSVFIIVLLTIFAGTGIYAATTFLGLFNGEGEDEPFGDAYNWNKTDRYVIHEKNIIYYQTSRFESAYSSGERFRITQAAANIGISDPNKGFIVSEQYGDFYATGALIGKSGGNKNLCYTGETEAYDVSGDLYSYDWGITLKLLPGSTYCPASKKIVLNLESVDSRIPNNSGNNELGNWTLNGSGSEDILTYTGSTSSGTIATSEIFNTNKVSVNGLIGSLSSSGALNSDVTFDFSDSANNKKYVAVDYDTSANRAELRQIVDKNIAQMTSKLSPSSIDGSILSESFLNNKDFHYYRSITNNHYFDNLGNKGENLQLGSGADDLADNAIEVKGERTILIEGGNIYINADIYNENKSSILTIVVKRIDGKANGGNIYIDPDVTNIDAVLVADGSIMSVTSFGSTFNIYDAQNHTEKLTKQLYIYGSIATSNNIGSNSAPYGSDLYIDNGGQAPAGEQGIIYNLEYLRAFEPILAQGVTLSDCDISGNIVSRTILKNYSPDDGKYEFAGKRECNLSDSGQGDLRTTGKLSPLVIEYNPLLQTNPPKILQK